jgi:N-acetylglutamate synthase-like GNAT family acetyltransferase
MSFSPIGRLQPANLAQLEALLRNNNLPVQDCAAQAQNFFGIFNGDELIAAGGLEPAGDYALLRSVVVREQYRSSGLARCISRYLIGLAETDSKKAVYLLTETAGAYFEKLGFANVDRAQVPRAITQTRQFASLCPDTASCMVLTLPEL